MLSAACAAVLGETVGVDADRVDHRLHRPAAMHEAAVLVGPNAEDLAGAFQESLAIGAGVEADHVVGAQRAQQLVGARQGVQQRRRHEGRVQEEADAVAHAERAQRLAEGDQVIVVHPDQVVGPQQRLQRLGEAAVDRDVAVVVLAMEVQQAEPEMQQRPQRAVGEVQVERAVFML